MKMLCQIFSVQLYIIKIVQSIFTKVKTKKYIGQTYIQKQRFK